MKLSASSLPLPVASAERLPAAVDLRGLAPTAPNFFPPPPPDAADAASASYAFRGRGLHFGRVAFPDDAAAYVVRTSVADASQKEVTHAVATLGYYNHGAEISDADALPQALEWVKVASVLHAELGAEDEDGDAKGGEGTVPAKVTEKAEEVRNGSEDEVQVAEERQQ